MNVEHDDEGCPPLLEQTFKTKGWLAEKFPTLTVIVSIVAVVDEVIWFATPYGELIPYPAPEGVRVKLSNIVTLPNAGNANKQLSINKAATKLFTRTPDLGLHNTIYRLHLTEFCLSTTEQAIIL